MQGHIWMSLVTEDVIINFSPVPKRLEDGVNLGPGLLKKQHIEMFSVGNFVLSKKKISHETVCSKHCSVKKMIYE